MVTQIKIRAETPRVSERVATVKIPGMVESRIATANVFRQLSEAADRCEHTNGSRDQEVAKFAAVCNSPDVRDVCGAVGIASFRKEDDPKSYMTEVVRVFAIVIAERYLHGLISKSVADVSAAIRDFRAIIDSSENRETIRRMGVKFGNTPYNAGELMLATVINDIFNRYAAASIAGNEEVMTAQVGRFNEFSSSQSFVRAVCEVTKVDATHTVSMGDLVVRYRTFSDS
ncbi:MAG: hypothetical protein Q7S22_05110 [Candidatus Micrarchaeota archaeon]|nr:hypothetical protein [Candidatus Micrarchaeota archaeon]